MKYYVLGCEPTYGSEDKIIAILKDENEANKLLDLYTDIDDEHEYFIITHDTDIEPTVWWKFERNYVSNKLELMLSCPYDANWRHVRNCIGPLLYRGQNDEYVYEICFDKLNNEIVVFIGSDCDDKELIEAWASMLYYDTLNTYKINEKGEPIEE